MQIKQSKLENPERIAELNPPATLKKIGLKEQDVLCDIGAGSGIFTVAAAEITKNSVYALEISEEMLNIIAQKAKSMALNNIKPAKVNDETLPLPDACADIALMVTVLHEIENKKVFIGEAARILKPHGSIAVIEFHKKQTARGPVVEHRLAKEEVEKLFKTARFVITQSFDMGDNFYCLVFQKQTI